MVQSTAKMYRLAKIGLAIFIVVSVASILITPDPSDDVNGVLQQRHVVKVPPARIPPAQSSISHVLVVKTQPLSARTIVGPNLLDLVCVLLC